MLILVQNLPVPFDRRVWQEAQTLTQAGYDVSVICPTGGEWIDRFEVIDGVRIHRYPPGPDAGTGLQYLSEYVRALWWQTLLVLRLVLSRPVDIVQVCNPPDFLFLPALPMLWFRRARLIFDHHDLNPELLDVKGFGLATPVLRRMMLFLERWTYRLSVVSIATNESYKRVAVARGGMDPDEVFVVRSGPNRGRFHGAKPDPSVKRGRPFLIAYVGVMGSQEGIDHLLQALALIEDRGVHAGQIQTSLAGSGPDLARLRHIARDLGLDETVTFLGRISDAELATLLATADLCVNPDLVNPMNDSSTMNKIMEYMAFGKPIVQYEMTEGRVSAGEASLYAEPNSPQSLADCIEQLLDDPERRERMGRCGRDRLDSTLMWEHQEPSLLRAYERALQSRGGVLATAVPRRSR